MSETETVGKVIDEEYSTMRQDWKLMVEQREAIERAVRYLENSMDDFWSNWLEGDKDGVYDMTNARSTR